MTLGVLLKYREMFVGEIIEMHLLCVPVQLPQFSSREQSEMSDRDREISQGFLKDTFGGVKPTRDLKAYKPLTDLVTAAMFSRVADQTAQKMAERSSQPVFLYKYNHQGTTSLADFYFMAPWQFLAKVRQSS